MAPDIDYALIAPIIALVAGVVGGLLIEAFAPRGRRSLLQAVTSCLAIVAALALTIVNWRSGVAQIDAEGALALDKVTWFTWAGLLFFALLSVLLFAERRVGGGDSAFVPMAAAVPGSQGERVALEAHQEHTEVFPLMGLSLLGMLLFAASNDLVMMFVSLEVLSLPLYLLTGLARRRRLGSHEAALKYFLLGAMSSAIFLYGVTLLYGYAGSFELRDLDVAVQAANQSESLLLGGLGLVLVGLLFKIGAAPFQPWVPDVYTGAPTPVTAFMAVCTKLAAVIALTRVLYVGLGGLAWTWQPVLAVVAVLTMVVGAMMGLTQTDIKRMLAYSSIAHAGFILVAVAGATTSINGLPEGQPGSIGAVLFYVAAYGLATMGAFGLLMVVRQQSGEATSLDAWSGLGRSHPVLGVAMTIFLLSMAGIPLTGGFVGKVLAFTAAWQGGFGWLVLVAVIASLVTAAFYLRIVWVMFFNDPTETTEVTSPGPALSVVLVVAAVGTVALGLVPGPLADLAANAAVFLR